MKGKYVNNVQSLDVKKNSASGMRIPVSVIILTYNEEDNIRDCLQHLDAFDDVIIVDSYSNDNTVEAGQEVRSDVRVFKNTFVDFGQQRNWAIDHTSPKYDWILFLDADEHCTPELVCEIKNTINNPGEYSGFYLTCRNFFLGKWIRRCTLYPSWQLRLFRKGEVWYRKEGHGQREVTEGPLGYLKEPYDHYGFSKGIHHWIARHNNYSSNEVELIYRLKNEPFLLKDIFHKDPVTKRRALKRFAARVGFRPVFRFIYLYFFRRGFLDGKEGFLFCLLRVAHEIHITVKLAEAENSNSHENTKKQNENIDTKS